MVFAEQIMFLGYLVPIQIHRFIPRCNRNNKIGLNIMWYFLTTIVHFHSPIFFNYFIYVLTVLDFEKKIIFVSWIPGVWYNSCILVLLIITKICHLFLLYILFIISILYVSDGCLPDQVRFLFSDKREILWLEIEYLTFIPIRSSPLQPRQKMVLKLEINPRRNCELKA